MHLFSSQNRQQWLAYLTILFFCALTFTGLTGCATSVDNRTRAPRSPRPAVATKPPASTPVPSTQTNSPVLQKPVVSEITDETLTNGNNGHTSPEFEKGPQACLDDALEFCRLAQEYRENGELDNALDALDQAYTLILKVDDTQNDIDLVQEKEDLRFLISKRILEIHASRQIVVSGTHDEIPLVMNSHVQKELDLFTTGREKEFFKKAYIRSGRYRAYIVNELKKEGMPVGLSWLPLIESGFKTQAMSPARALGMWQFIPSTGYKFGLTRDTYIDERMDPVKATAGAIAYMKELHQMFGDWTTVLAAYNCGEGRVLRTINSQNINYLDNFWDLYEKLPRETARYVPRFLATLHIMKNKHQYGLDTVQLDEPVSYSVVPVARRSHLKNYASVMGVSEETLKMLNPELRTAITPTTTYDLKVPQDKKSLLLAKLHTVPVTKSEKPKNKYAYHKVRRGQNISSIARRYGVSIRTISRANNLNRRYTILVGQTLKIPLSRNGYVAQAASKKKSYKPVTHRVRKGDSLWNLAKRYGTNTRAIQRANKMRGTTLKIGQKLSIPGGKSIQLASSKKKVQSYRVKKGDTSFGIALKNGMTLTRFLKLNKMSKRSKIFPGQKVYVE